MARYVRHIVTILLIASCSVQCVEPFQPNIPESQTDILVVDGYVNAGIGVSEFQLSRVVPANGNQQIQYETGAEVFIQNKTDQSFPLTETSPGRYATTELNLPVSGEYRISVQRKNGKRYESDYARVKITPPIDSLHWEWDRIKGLQIYVNAHDPLNQTRYYQWEFQEDWQIRSPFLSLLTYANDTIEERDPRETLAMYNCWVTSRSKDLIFTSSANMIGDHVKFNLVTIPAASDKTSVKYSIIVKQHTLTTENHQYLHLMMKNSTNLGSWFDSMPTELNGNIRCITDSEEIVVGYVGAYTMEKLTYFLNPRDIPSQPDRESCITDEFENTPANLETFLGGSSSYIPFETFYEIRNGVPFPMVRVIERPCVDCRVYGTNVKPVHWP